MKRIVKNEEKLHIACEPVKFVTEDGVDKNFGIETIAAIKEVMEAKPDIVALSAPQIGIKARVFCIRFNDCIKTFINPVITKKTAPKFVCETSISFPGKQFLLMRPTEVEIKYYTDEFKYEDNKLLGAAAGIFDQQYQFLDGMTPTDLSLVSDVETDGEITDEDLDDTEFMQAAFEIYKQLIAQKAAQSKEAVEAEPEAIQSQYRQMSVAEGVVNGRITVIDPEMDKQQQVAKKAAVKAQITENSMKKQIANAELKNFLNKKGK